MIDGLTIAMAIVAIILCVFTVWLYYRGRNKKPMKILSKQDCLPSNQEYVPSYRSIEKKTISKPTKPFHPELLKDYKINAHTGTTFKGDAKTPDEIKNDQRKKDWNN